MTAKISGIKIPVTIDSSGIDTGISSLKQKLSSNLTAQSTLSTGPNAAFGVGPFGGGSRASPVGSGLMGSVLSASAARSGAMSALSYNPYNPSSNLSMAWAQSTGQKIHVVDLSTPSQKASKAASKAAEALQENKMKTAGLLQSAMSFDLPGVFSAAGEMLGVGAGTVALGAAGIGAAALGYKKLYDFSQAKQNATASLPASYRQSDPYNAVAMDIARRAQMTTPKGKGGYGERLATAMGQSNVSAAVDLAGTAIGEMFSAETFGMLFGMNAAAPIQSVQNISNWAGHEKEVFTQWYVRNYGNEQQLRDMRRANQRAAIVAQRTAI